MVDDVFCEKFLKDVSFFVWDDSVNHSKKTLKSNGLKVNIVNNINNTLVYDVLCNNVNKILLNDDFVSVYDEFCEENNFLYDSFNKNINNFYNKSYNFMYAKGFVNNFCSVLKTFYVVNDLDVFLSVLLKIYNSEDCFNNFYNFFVHSNYDNIFDWVVNASLDVDRFFLFLNDYWLLYNRKDFCDSKDRELLKDFYKIFLKSDENIPFSLFYNIYF